MRFTKWQGAGNDFIIPDEINFTVTSGINDFTKKICDRHFGVGADGLCLLETTDKADIRMRLINADGSEAEMCGNLIRCVARHLHEIGFVQKNEMSVETLAGIMIPEVIVKDGKIVNVKVDMGVPKTNYGDIPIKGNPLDKATNVSVTANGRQFLGTGVSMGNPHFVIYLDDVDSVELKEIGPLIENNEMFPAKANIEFVQVLNKNKIRMRVWERGAGVTQACGTGACASTVAGVLAGKIEPNTEVILDGGSLFIEWDEDSGHIYMSGSAVKVFAGEYFI